MTTTVSGTAARPAFVNNISFNNNKTRFTVATSQGFRIYNCNPFLQLYSHETDYEISVADIITETVTALVKVGSTDILIWNNLLNCIVRRISLTPPPRRHVKAVKPLSDNLLLVITTDNQTYELHIYPPDQIKIHDNVIPTYSCSVSSGSNDDVLMVCCQNVFACDNIGKIMIKWYPSGRHKTVQALIKTKDVTCISLSPDGLLVALLEGGDFIKIYDTVHGFLLNKLQILKLEENKEVDQIWALTFSNDGQWLAVSNDMGEVCVFGHDTKPIQSLTFDFMSSTLLHCIKGVLKSGNKECLTAIVSAHFRLSRGVRNIVTFGSEINTLNIIGVDGSFYRCKFDMVKGGEMILLERHNFMKLKDD